MAAYEIVVGIEGLNSISIWAYTVSFGVLIVASLLMIIYGFDILESQLVVIVAAIIPLGFSLGLITEYVPQLSSAYLVFVVIGFLAIILTRTLAPPRAATIVLSIVHGISGLVIFFLPIALTLAGTTPPSFLFISLGGALIGIGGLMLAFLKSGKPLLPAEKIFMLLPWLLMFMTVSFALGLGLA